MNRAEKRKAIRNSQRLGFGLVGTFQTIMSEPQKLLVGEYTTKSGQVKNRYAINVNSKPIKTIFHHKILN